MVAESLRGTCGTRLKIDGDQRERQGEEVGEIVSGLGEQRQRVGADSGHDQQHDIGEGHSQRNL